MTLVLAKVLKTLNLQTKMPYLTILSIFQGLNLQQKLLYLKSTVLCLLKCNVSSETKKL